MEENEKLHKIRVELEKAKQEYRKYQEKTIAPVEQAYLDTIHDLEKEAKKQIRNRK